MKIQFLFFFTLSVSLLAAQNNNEAKIQQLEKLIQLESSPKQKGQLLLEQARLWYRLMDFDKQTQALNKALLLAKANQDTSQIIEANLQLGEARWENLESLNQRRAAVDNALQLATIQGNPLLVARAKDNEAVLLESDSASYTAILNNLNYKKKHQAPKYELAKSYSLLGAYATNLLKKDSSLYYLNQSLALLKESEATDANYTLKAETYRALAHHYNAFKYKEALTPSYIDSSLHIFKSVVSIPEENKTRILLSEYLTDYDRYEEALNEVNQVVNNSKQYVNGEVLGMMGLLSYYNKNYNESIEYYKKSLAKYQLVEDGYAAAESQAAIAFVYGQIKSFEEGLAYIEPAVAYAEQSNNKKLLATTYYAKSKLLSDLGKHRASIQFRHKVINLHQELGRKRPVHEQMLSLAGSYIDINQLDSAEHYNRIGYDFFKPINEKGPLSLAYRNFYNIYKEQKDFEKALTSLESYHAYQDSLKRNTLERRLNEERANLKVVEAKESVNIAERKKALAEQEAQLLSFRNSLYLALAALLGLVLLAGLYFFSKLRKSKAQIESQNEQLQQLNATKDKFFGIIAHDIRSPIVALDGVGEQMAYHLKKDNHSKLEKLAINIDKTAKRLSGLLDNLLNWALLQQGVIPYHPQRISLKQSGQQVLDMFQNNATVKNIKLVNQVESDIQAYVDESALNTILRNLISNAIKFTPEGGRVSLAASSKNGMAYITVNDTGTGISLEQQKQLFSLDRKSKKGTAGEKGTGLGLNLVKELIELNKGSIKVTSSREKGTSFELGLPMS